MKAYKKDFEAIARAINKSLVCVNSSILDKRILVNLLIDVLVPSNEKFNPSKFRKACGVEAPE